VRLRDVMNIKRYRISYRDGVVEDVGQVFPVDASRQMMLAEDHDTCVMEIKNGVVDLVNASWAAYELLKKHGNFSVEPIEARVLRDAIETLGSRLTSL
jgi:hypothetical protein